MTAQDLALALARTTLATAAAACLAALLLAWLKVESPRMHRVAWALVVLQGWILIPWTLEFEAPPAEARAPLLVGGVSDADHGHPWIAASTSETPLTRIHDAAPLPIAPLMLLAWLAGAALLILAAAWRYLRVVRALPLGVALDDRTWRREWTSARNSSTRACRHRVLFRLTDRLGPLVAYIPFTYLLLAPRPLWTALTPPERTAILRHELAHIRRRDLWKSLALRLLALPQWFNPLVWLAVRRFDEAAEWACDADAARGWAHEPTTVANALLRTAELTASNSPMRAAHVLPAVPSANNPRRRSTLARRIHRLVTPRSKEESTMRKLAVPALLAVIAAAQLIRIERVSASDPPPLKGREQPSTVASGDRAQGGSLSGNSEILDPAAPTPPEKLQEFAEIANREFEKAAERPYTIEPPDILTIKFSATIEGNRVVDGVSIAQTELETKPTQYLVGLDGKVRFGYEKDSVYVTGMTVDEARLAIEEFLQQHYDDVKATVEVHKTNSKVCYVIDEGHGIGNVVRMPVPYPLTVDFNVGKVIQQSGPRDFDLAHATIKVARPAPNGMGSELILPVAWDNALKSPAPETNYPILPGDRLFIETPQGDQKAATHWEPLPATPALPPKMVEDSPEAVEPTAYDRPAAQGDESPATAPQTQRAVFISLRMPDGKGVEWPVELARGASIGQVLDDTTYPLPVDFAKALISVSRTFRTMKDGRTVDGETTWFAGWDAAANTVVGPPYDTMQPGDRITIDMSKTPPPVIARNPASPVAPHPLAADSLDAAAPTPAQLQVHDIVTVLVDPVREEGIRPPSFRIACEIKEIRPNGNLYLEGQAAIRNIDQWWELSLSGEVRREEIQPDRTVSSRSIVNLDIVKRELRAETASVVEDHDGERDGVRGVHDNDLSSPLETPAIQPNPQPRYAPAPAGSARIRPRPNNPRPIKYDLAILVDRDGDLAELTDNGDSLICDAAVLRPALRILTKHNLASRLSSPRIVSTVGRPAEFTIAAPIPGKDRLLFHAAQKVTILCVRDDAGPDGQSMLVELGAQVTHDNEKSVIDYGFSLREGQTALVRLQTVDHKPGPVYIALTPKRVQ